MNIHCIQLIVQAKSLSDLDGELSSDLGPKIDKMYQKACETNPEKQTYGPETCEKVCLLFLVNEVCRLKKCINRMR